MTTFSMRQFYIPDDLALLAELKNAYWRHYRLDQITTPEKQKFLLTLDNHSPKDDNRVMTHPEHADRLIGHVWVWRQTPDRAVFDITVHPDWQRQGLGSQFLLWAIERARQLGVDAIDQQVSIDSAPERQFLRKHGFRPLGTFLNMRLDNTQIEPPTYPDSYRIQTLADIDDIRLYSRLLNRCYYDLWGHHTSSTEADHVKWLAYYDPAGIFILFAPSGEAVGIVRAQSVQQINSQDGTHRNSIDAPGLIPTYRQPELYEALVRQGVSWLNAEVSGLNSITMLSWGDLDSAIDRYWQIGFDVVQHEIGYRCYLT